MDSYKQAINADKELMEKRCKVVSMEVDVTDLQQSVQLVEKLSKLNVGAYVCVSNVHMCMEVLDSIKFAGVVNNADLIIADGKPISWAQKLLGHSFAAQVRGQDITNALCEISAAKRYKVGLYGGSSNELLERVKFNLNKEYPGIDIAYAFSPPYRPLTEEEDGEVISDINLADVDILFVGIGCPKQEIWMAAHKKKLSCVMLGVGAVFNFIAREKTYAPRWMQKIGFEWLFRLLCEPSRLWRRYFRTNPRFVWHFTKQLLKYKLQIKET